MKNMANEQVYIRHWLIVTAQFKEVPIQLSVSERSQLVVVDQWRAVKRGA